MSRNLLGLASLSGRCLILLGLILLGSIFLAPTASAETGVLNFDGTETFQTKGGTNPNTSVVVEGGLLKATLGHGNYETTRLQVPLSQAYNGATDEFRLRTRARVLNTSTPFRFLQWGGFYNDAGGNRISPDVLAMGGTNNGDDGANDYPNYLFSGTNLNRGPTQPSYENGEDIWYIYEAHFDVANSVWESWVYSDVNSPGGSQLLFHTDLDFGNTPGNLDVYSFGATNDVDPPTDPNDDTRLVSYEMDWAIWSINEPLVPEPSSLALLILCGLASLTHARRRG